MADQASDSPILDLLASMNRAGIEASCLDAQSLMLVRLAALVAVSAPPVSYMLNLEMAGDVERRRQADRGHARRDRPDRGLCPRRVRGWQDGSRARDRAQPRGARRAAGLSRAPCSAPPSDAMEGGHYAVSADSAGNGSSQSPTTGGSARDRDGRAVLRADGGAPPSATWRPMTTARTAPIPSGACEVERGRFHRRHNHEGGGGSIPSPRPRGGDHDD